MSLTNALAMDCEMVGAGPNGSINLPGRVSLVNENGACVYDTYVKPNKKVTDYRTFVSGITSAHLAQGKPFNVVKQEVARYIKGRILVGHSVDKDLRVLGLCHPDWNIRDTTEYPPFQTDLRVLGLCHPDWNIRDTTEYPPFQTRNGTPSLKYLARRYLGLSIQNGPHSSVQDARAAMRLYKKVEDEWEEWLSQSESDSEDESEVYYNEHDSGNWKL